MSKHHSFCLLPILSIMICNLGLFLLTDRLGSPGDRPDQSLTHHPAAVSEAKESYGRLPLSFEMNQGQTDHSVKFLSRGQGYGLFLTPTEAILALAGGEQNVNAKGIQATIVRMSVGGARATPEMVGLNPLPGRSHYFQGKYPAESQTDVPHYAKVKYDEVYPGIDLIYYGNQRQLEYDFIVAPGADPEKIKLVFRGVDKIDIDQHGQLVLRTPAGDIIQHKPIIYQENEGQRAYVEGNYERTGKWEIGFRVNSYDNSKPLIIDPVLSYSTFLGGGTCPGGGCASSDDAGLGIALDSEGNAYITGRTLGFPTAPGSFDTVCGNPVGPRGEGGCAFVLASSDCSPCTIVYRSDAFVTKINASGTALVYSTYLGGSSSEGGFDVAVDGAGNAYVTGHTRSSNFPTTTGAYSTVCGCGQFIDDVFVTKLNTSGSALIFSTFLGGSGVDLGLGIALDAADNSYVTGSTTSSDFPLVNAVQPAPGGGSDAFVAKLNAAGTALVYSTFLGGSGNEEGRAITVDENNNAFVTGSTWSANFPIANPFQAGFGGAIDAFITIVEASGAAIGYSTYLGGNGQDRGYGIAVAGGDIYVTGSTASTNFPTTTGGFTGAFATKLNTGAGLLYSINPGGSVGYGIAVGSAGNAYVAGANGADAFVTQLDAAGTAPVYSVALGGAGVDAAFAIAIDSAGNAYVTGSTASGDFETTPLVPQPSYGGGSSDVFVSKIAIASAVLLSSSTYNSAEAAGNVTITVERIGLTSGAISVDYSTSNGSAVAGSDYTATAGTISFADGDSTPKTFTVPIINDTAVESSETVVITLSNPVGNVFLNSPGAATLTIADDDTALFFSAPAFSIGESSGSAAITVSRSGNSAAAVSVSYATNQGTAVAGSDYTAASGVVSFAAGDLAPKTFFVPIINDTSGEPNETLTLTLGNPTGGATVGTPAAASLTIIDDDPSPNPAISAVTVSNLTFNSARICWTTNEGADSQVEYGTTTAYGTSTVLAPNLVTTHCLDLTGLSASTLYHFRVRSRNASGQLAISADNTFTTSGGPPPTVTSASPNSVFYGVSASSSITILGLNFVSGATITVGSLSGVTVPGATSSATTPFVFVNSNVLRFWWPNTSLSPGSHDVRVTNPPSADGLSHTLFGGFTVNPPQPTVVSTSPAQMTYAISPNSSITISGSNFVAGATVTIGSLSGATVAGSIASAAAPFVFVNSGTLRFWWPNTSLAPGSHTVQVTNPAAAGGLSASLPSGFTVAAPQPAVTNTTPAQVTYAITPSLSITITGSNFVAGATVTVGGLSGVTVAGSVASAATPFVFVNSATLRFWWPNTSLAPGSHTVQVTNPAAAGGLSASLPSGFTVAAPQPGVTNTTPAQVTYAITPSLSITITGSNFVAGATVAVGGLSGTTVPGSLASAATPFVFVNNATLRFWWPNTSLPPGSHMVQVTNPAAAGGLSASLSAGFTVAAPQPAVTSTSSPVTFGSTSRSITIFGSNFVLGARITVGSISGITISGSSATAATPFVFTNSGQLKFWWPSTALPVGGYTVTITNPAAAGGLAGSLTDGFVVSQ